MRGYNLFCVLYFQSLIVQYIDFQIRCTDGLRNVIHLKLYDGEGGGGGKEDFVDK